MYCICCKKDKILPGSYPDDMNEEDFIWKVEKKDLETEEEKEYFGSKVQITNANNRMWNDGIVHIIDAGYGSGHDTDRFVIAICDKCITENLEDGTLLYHGNYMSPDSPFVEEQRYKSKQIYRRRRNLDNLV